MALRELGSWREGLYFALQRKSDGLQPSSVLAPSSDARSPSSFLLLVAKGWGAEHRCMVFHQL